MLSIGYPPSESVALRNTHPSSCLSILYLSGVCKFLLILNCRFTGGPVCPLVRCSNQCPFGFQKTARGCNTCQCSEWSPLPLPDTNRSVAADTELFLCLKDRHRAQLLCAWINAPMVFWKPKMAARPVTVVSSSVWNNHGLLSDT